MMEKSCKTCSYEKDLKRLYHSEEPKYNCDQIGVFSDFYDECEMWKEKETDSVTYSTGQMIDMLLVNPKRKAKLIGERGFLGTAYFEKGNLMYMDVLFRITDDEGVNRWTIIEPEPVKVNFIEAFKKFKISELNEINAIKSLVTNKIYENSLSSDLYDATDEEIDGMWEIMQ